jgi:hypothetical protein
MHIKKIELTENERPVLRILRSELQGYPGKG